MKLTKVVLENFRQFEHREFDLTDSLGRPRDRTLIVGPNGSGKTTILDAIALGLQQTMGWSTTRPDLRLTPRSIVRRGANQAFVTCHVRFSSQEIEATREIFRLARKGGVVPDATDATFHWRYPSDNNPRGLSSCEPGNAWMLLQGRKMVAKLLRTGIVGWDWLRRAGAAFTFDSHRSQFGKLIPEDIQRIIAGHEREEDVGASQFSSDPKTILLNLVVKAQFPTSPRYVDPFPSIKEKFAELCAPRRIIGAFQDDLGQLDIQFSDGVYEYGFDGLSSGEATVLLFLVRMASDNIHRSILLVEEVELHQHPIWQRRLLHLLSRMGDDNQLIATTHSEYLSSVASPEEILELGPIRPERSDG